jgi:toxin ParE1/3/4
LLPRRRRNSETVEYLESQRTGSGDEFERQVQNALDMIGKQPRAYSPYRDRYRKYVVRKFGCLIFYVGFDDHVWVAAVANGRRRPDYWADREPK